MVDIVCLPLWQDFWHLGSVIGCSLPSLALVKVNHPPFASDQKEKEDTSPLFKAQLLSFVYFNLLSSPQHVPPRSDLLSVLTTLLCPMAWFWFSWSLSPANPTTSSPFPPSHTLYFFKCKDENTTVLQNPSKASKGPLRLAEPLFSVGHSFWDAHFSTSQKRLLLHWPKLGNVACQRSSGWFSVCGPSSVLRESNSHSPRWFMWS